MGTEDGEECCEKFFDLDIATVDMNSEVFPAQCLQGPC